MQKSEKFNSYYIHDYIKNYISNVICVQIRHNVFYHLRPESHEHDRDLLSWS